LGVRTVDGGVAAGAVAEARLHVTRRGRRMALIAELGDLLVTQQMPVRAAVRLVAAPAAFQREPAVLVDERPLPLAVAAEAGVLLAVAQQRGVGRPVGVVGVGVGGNGLRGLWWMSG